MTYKKNQLKQLPLFLTKEKDYVLIGEIFCDGCKKLLDSTFLLLTDLSKTKYVNKIFCHNCATNYQRQPSIIYETKIGYIKAIPSKSDTPVLMIPINLKDSKNNETVFTAVNLDSEKTNDQAWRSRIYPSLEGASIGKPVEQLEKEEAKRLEQSEKFLLENKTRGVNK